MTVADSSEISPVELPVEDGKLGNRGEDDPAPITEDLILIVRRGARIGAEYLALGTEALLGEVHDLAADLARCHWTPRRSDSGCWVTTTPSMISSQARISRLVLRCGGCTRRILSAVDE